MRSNKIEQDFTAGVGKHMNPRVTVFTPVYNRERYVSESIESVLNQTYTNFEFLICDDGSTDSTWGILEKYANQDNRIKIFKNTSNQGVSATSNYLISKATGDYLARMDSDDLWARDKLKIQVDFLDNNPKYDVVDTRCRFINSKGRKIIYAFDYMTMSGHINEYLTFQFTVYNSATMYRLHKLKTLFPDRYIYKHDLYIAEDYDLWCRIKDDMKFYKLPQVLYFYRRHEHNISSDKEKLKESISDIIGIVRKNIKKDFGVDISDGGVIWTLHNPYSIPPFDDLKVNRKSFEKFLIENKDTILASKVFSHIIFLAVIYQASLGKIIIGFKSLPVLFSCFNFKLIKPHIIILILNPIKRIVKIILFKIGLRKSIT